MQIQTLCHESSRFDVSMVLKSSNGKNDLESHRTTEGFRMVSSLPAKEIKIRHENETATSMESRRVIANFLLTPPLPNWVPSMTPGWRPDPPTRRRLRESERALSST